MTGQEERVSEHLNEALASLMAQHERLHLLGEDLVDPYGGAFKISRGLSSRFPGRVLSTPISESGLIGVANGLALAGCPVIAELMFGDFIGLAFDQLLNFAAKSVTMFGRPVPLRVVVRCPVGGHRGYGPTHSQSPQKHLIGIPHPLHAPHAPPAAPRPGPRRYAAARPRAVGAGRPGGRRPA